MDLLDPQTAAQELRRLLSDPQPSPQTRSQIDRVLRSLEGGHYARHIPAAPHTWEGSATLTTTAAETGECLYQFARPVEITGLRVTCTPLDLPPTPAEADIYRDHIAPRLLDFLTLSVSWLSDAPHTQHRSLDAGESERIGAFVSASVLTHETRLYRVQMTSPNAQVGWRARWRMGAPLRAIMPDHLVSVALVGRHI